MSKRETVLFTGEQNDLHDEMEKGGFHINEGAGN
jgi:hypothetical protein